MALVEAAKAASRTKGTYLAAQYARLKGRRGHKRATIAVAHSILVIADYLLQRGEPYSDLGADYFADRQSTKAYKNRLVPQLQRLGHKSSGYPRLTAPASLAAAVPATGTARA
jgi:transposase